jgi:flagellar hook-associated protein 3 FlgL
MRVTDRMGFNQVINNLQKNRGEMSELQNQAALQKRITKPSDDPLGAARVLGYHTEERGSEQFIKNIAVAKSFLEFTDVSLGEVSEVLMRLKELAIQQANDASAGPETRRTVAEEVKQTYGQLLQVGNRKMGERYIFGGQKTTEAPFDREGNYAGDEAEIIRHINKDAFLAMNLSGDKVFLGKGLSDDGFARPSAESPRNTEQLEKFQMDEHARLQKNQDTQEHQVRVRGLASIDERGEQSFKSELRSDTAGVNILDTVKKFEIALRVNDKSEVQECIDDLDRSISQVVNSRAQVGARLQTLNHSENSLRQNIVDNKTTASQIEDADLFQVASDMNKADSALKASLETSGKIITPSLLDFLK